MRDGRCDYKGIKERCYDAHLGGFSFKDGYSDKEWRALHPISKREEFLIKNKKGSRGISALQIEDMDVLKSARKHDKLTIASLKRKLGRHKKQKERVDSNDEDVVGLIC